LYFARKSYKLTKPAESLRKENEEKFSLQAMDQKLWGILDKYAPKFATENSFVLPKLKSLNPTENKEEQKIVLPKLKML
jgi:hypothetical protein